MPCEPQKHKEEVRIMDYGLWGMGYEAPFSPAAPKPLLETSQKTGPGWLFRLGVIQADGEQPGHIQICLARWAGHPLSNFRFCFDINRLLAFRARYNHHIRFPFWAQYTGTVYQMNGMVIECRY